MKKTSAKIISGVLVVIILLLCSCNKDYGIDEDLTANEGRLEVVGIRRALHFSEAVRVGNDMYFHCGNSNDYDGGRIQRLVLSDYGTESFEINIACFDPTCNHTDSVAATCCANSVYYRVNGQFPDELKNNRQYWYKSKLQGLVADGTADNPNIILWTGQSLYVSNPFENKKILLDDGSNEQPIDITSPLLYDGYIYYYKAIESVGAQWRVAVSGGNPERVFEQDNIKINDIIDGKYYVSGLTVTGTRGYSRVNPDLTEAENLPDYWKTALPFYFDEQFGYIAVQDKIYKFDKNNISAEPELLLSIRENTSESSRIISLCNASSLHYILLDDLKQQSYTSYSGVDEKYQEYGIITYGTYDVSTGEHKKIDLKTEYLLNVNDLLYADGDYIYLKCANKYAVEINMTSEQKASVGLTLCRITLEEMKYEYIN